MVLCIVDHLVFEGIGSISNYAVMLLVVSISYYNGQVLVLYVCCRIIITYSFFGTQCVGYGYDDFILNEEMVFVMLE